MNIAVIIPSRYASTRFPGKPLAEIAGKSLLARVWAIAKSAAGVSGVYVATDDSRIFDHARAFGAEVVMTPADCANGGERVLAAARLIDPRPDAVVNLQGDAALTPPWVLQAVIDAMKADPSLPMVTAAVRLTPEQLREMEASKDSSPTSGTLVVFDRHQNALYFSKALIPSLREPGAAQTPHYRHVGIYGYRLDVLKNLQQLPEGPLERAEKLEQLRALENGIPVRVVIVDYRGRTHWSVDTPEDAAKTAAIIAREGELV